jgi:flagellar hook-basal body complex protein FliE
MLMDFEHGLGNIIDPWQIKPDYKGFKLLKPEEKEETPVDAFADAFTRALNIVNDKQIESMELSEKMILEPDSVNIHDMTIAIAEANLSLSMTKAIFDGAIRAYKEIINTR